MAKRESKPTAQTATEEYVLLRVTRRGEQGVFSHPSEAAARAVHAQCVAEDHKQGCAFEYKLNKRTVSGADVDEQEVNL